MTYLALAWAFACAHWTTILFAVLLGATVLNKLLPGHPALSGIARQAVAILACTPMAGARSAVLSLVASKLGDGNAAALFDWLSKWIDVPLVSKSVVEPLTIVNGTARGHVRIVVLVFIAALAFACAAFADTPAAGGGTLADVAASEPPVQPSRYGGCFKMGKAWACAAPEASITLAAINLTTGRVEGAFAPGIGYGIKLWPDQWYALGLAGHFALDVGAQRASAGIFISLFNGYVSIGFDKEFITSHDARIPYAVAASF